MSGSVLVVDGSRARAGRLRDALLERGFATHRVENGAAALEAALADLPDAVIASHGIELIAAAKLAEILRANPRTRHVAFLLLGELPADAPEQEYLDEVLPLASEARDVALRAEVLCAQRARQAATWRDAQGDHEVEGSFEQVPLIELLRLFHGHRRTGALTLTRQEPDGREERGELLLRDGSVVAASTGPVAAEKALFRVLAWKEGRFSFRPATVDVERPIATPTRALLAEATRQLDEWDRLRANLPPLEAQVAPRPSGDALPEGVHPLTREVLALVEAHPTVREVVDHSVHPDYQVLRTLQTLVDRDLVQLRHGGTTQLRRASDGLFSPPQARRLREWLTRGRPRSEAPAEARLLVVASDAAATRDFVRLLAGLPGAAIEEGFRDGRAAANDLLPIGRLAVDAGLDLELLHLPAGPEFAPLWPVAAHRALGTVVLLGQPLEDAEVAVHAAVEGLRSVPASRLFHVLLLRKGERLAPDQLSAKLGLLDRASLFLLPLEGESDPAALLRTMLARVMP